MSKAAPDSPAATPSPPANAASFDTYDAFVKQAIKDYYDRGWRSRKGNFVALVMASGQMGGLAKDTLTGEKGLQRAAIGAAGIVALRVGLAFALTGPLGILVTGLAAASLVAFFVKNQKEVSEKLPKLRRLLTETKTKFEEIQAGYRANRYAAPERNLMVEGLMRRFLTDCDEA